MKLANRLSIILFISIIAVIIISTSLKVATRHKEALLYVTSSRIEEAARKCYLEEKCEGDRTTLGEIIEEGYLGSQIHPITKEFISKDLVINCENFICETNLE